MSPSVLVPPSVRLVGYHRNHLDFDLGAILDQPNGPLATVLSILPWTAPVTMMMRLPAGGVPPWATRGDP